MNSLTVPSSPTGMATPVADALLPATSTDYRALFEQYLIHRRQVESSTAYDYLRGLDRIERETGVPPHLLSALVLEDFLASDEIGWSAKNLSLVAARLFHTWGARRGYWKLDPEIPELRLRRQRGRETQPLTLPEAQRVLGLARSPIERRLVYLGLWAGLRLIEITSLQPSWWVVGVGGAEELRVLGKGSYRRVIPVHVRLAERRAEVLAGAAERRRLMKAMRRLQELSGIEHLSTRTLRRTFAERLSRAGVERDVIGALLGHAVTSVTTGHYAPVRWKEQQKAIEQLDYGTGQMPLW